MNYQVPVVNIVAMVVSLALSVGVAAAGAIVGKVKGKAKLSSMFLGCAGFLVSAMILEQIFHVIILAVTGNVLKENIWLYAIYGGLCAGVFEETGRYVVMKFAMKKNLDKSNALMYGVGHGGIEAILIGGLTSISNIATAVTINNGMLEGILAPLDEATRATVQQQCAQLWELPAYMFTLVGIERLLAFTLQVCLSYLVYRAVKYGNIRSYLLAILIHMLVDTGAVLLAKVTSAVVVLAVLAVADAAMVFLTTGWYQKEQKVKASMEQKM